MKKIKTKEDYNAAIAKMEAIGDMEDFEDNPELIAEFDRLGSLVALYEKANYQLEPGHPLEMIKLKMDSLGVRQKDLVPLIGSSGVVSEVFNRKRGLSKDMIRELSALLHIEQEALNREYELTGKAAVEKSVKTTAPEFAFLGVVDRVLAFKNTVRSNGLVFNICAA